MTDSFEQLVTSLSTSSPSDDLLQQIQGYLQEQTDEQASLFIIQSFQPLLSLERWAWRLLSEYTDRPKCFELLNTLGVFNHKLIFNTGNIEANVKFSLLIPDNIQWMNEIFQHIEKTEDPNDPFLAVINQWFHNLSYSAHEHEQLQNLPILIQIYGYIGDHYLFSDEYQYYLTELRQPQLSPSIFTAKQLFYISTCSSLFRMYVGSKLDKSPFKGEDILQRYGKDILEILIIHSSNVSSWSAELLTCITRLMDFMCACCWWGGSQAIHIGILNSFEEFNSFIEGLIRIVGHEPFHELIASKWSNDPTILIDAIFIFLLGALLEIKDLSCFIRSTTPLSDIASAIAQKSSYDRISLCAYGILAQILSDAQLKEVKVTDKISQFFFRILELAWSNPLQQYKKIPIPQLLTGLLNLSKNDAIQQNTADLHRISLLIEMSEQYPVVYKIIWALSFNGSIQEQLLLNQSFMQKLTILMKECNDVKMSKIISGILWNLDSEHQNRPISEENTEKKFDIMVSYSHRDEAMCKQIYAELTKAGYKIWIDYDQIHGNVMDAMAQAIEQSRIILICMSEQYHRSSYCRAEANYAFQRQLKIVPILLQEHYLPDGWLLFLIGQLHYVDFASEALPRAVEKLVEELQAVTDPQAPVKSVQPEKEITIVDPKAAVLPDKVLDWTRTHVQSWLLEYNLKQLARLLTDYDGRSLNSLSELIVGTNSEKVLHLFDEDSQRRINESVSLIELARFRALLGEKQVPSEKKKKRLRSRFGCQLM